MPRYKLTIEYDGTPYSGWQIQENGPSVQGQLREAVRSFCGEDVIPRGAGRTDSGVHATGQVAHIDLTRDWPADTVLKALNYYLRPEPVAILACDAVPGEFDARFSAKARHYRYRIANRRAPLTLDAHRAWRVVHHLDAEAMQAGAAFLIGRHDFTAFRAAGCQAKSPLRTLDVLSVERCGDGIDIRASARSFLHHQVRSIVGSLKHVGEGRWRPEAIGEVLEARDRKRCGTLAPACGLYLIGVDY